MMISPMPFSSRTSCGSGWVVLLSGAGLWSLIWSHPSLCLWRTPRTWTPWCIYTCWSSPWTFLKLLKNTFLCQPDDEQMCVTGNSQLSQGFIDRSYQWLSHDRVNGIVHFWYTCTGYVLCTYTEWLIVRLINWNYKSFTILNIRCAVYYIFFLKMFPWVWPWFGFKYYLIGKPEYLWALQIWTIIKNPQIIISFIPLSIIRVW